MNFVFIPADLANELRYEDEVDDWRVVQRETVGQKRWESVEQAIIQCCSCNDDRFFELIWFAGLTEYQETQDFEEPVRLKEVFPKEKTVVVYE